MPKISQHLGLNDNGSVEGEFENIYNSTPAISYGSAAPTDPPSKIGDIYLDTTAKREYRAFGISTSADWIKIPVFYSTTTTITNADVTITTPWDWSGGKAEIIVSGTTARWCDDGTTFSQMVHHTTYDALTSAGYTTTNSYVIRHDTPWADAYSLTINSPALPKAATSTTLVLRKMDASNTVYAKVLIWA